ncbi:MAG: hypothetical protein R3E50_16660, partial [Halioglobus sp.]
MLLCGRRCRGGRRNDWLLLADNRCRALGNPLHSRLLHRQGRGVDVTYCIGARHSNIHCVTDLLLA